MMGFICVNLLFTIIFSYVPFFSCDSKLMTTVDRLGVKDRDAYLRQCLQVNINYIIQLLFYII